MKKTILLFWVFSFPVFLFSQNEIWEKYGVETVLSLADPVDVEEDFYVVDSLYCHYFDSTLTEQPLSRKYNLDFTEEGAVLESISQNYDSNAGFWRNDKREILTYDGAGNIAEQLAQTWDMAVLNWRNESEVVNTWNAANNLEVAVNRYWIPAENDWQNFDKLTFGYSAEGDLESFQQELWDTLDMEWERNFRILYVTNSEGQVISTVFQLWVDNEFKSLSRTFHTFDGTLEMVVVTEVWDGYEEMWVNSSRQLREYDANDNRTSETSQIWLVQDTVWENQSRILQNYNGDGDVTLRTQLTWGGDNWVNFFQTENSYDTVGNLVRFQVSEWVVSEWVPFSSCDFYWRFHHEIILGTTENALFCALPNPYRIGTPFLCENLSALSDGGKIWMEVFDLNGRKIFSENIEGRDFMEINRPMKEGLYILAFRDERGVLFSEKIWVK